MEDSDGNRPLYSPTGDPKEEQKAQQAAREYYVSTAVAGAGLLKEFTTRSGWEIRFDSGNTNTKTQNHVHVTKGKKWYAQNEDGSPHDGSQGSPPDKVKEDIFKKSGWDKKAAECEKKKQEQNILVHVEGCEWLTNGAPCNCSVQNFYYFFYLGPNISIPNGASTPVPSYSFGFAY